MSMYLYISLFKCTLSIYLSIHLSIYNLPETLPEAPTPPLAIPAAKTENLASYFLGNKRDLNGRKREEN